MKSALIATDFSAEAEAARRRAASIARETGLGGTIVHVLPASLPADMHLEAASQAQKALALVTEEMTRDGLRFEPHLASGQVADALASAARQHDMIVAGARGEDVLLAFSLGRTSTRLVRQCDQPVLIVKRPPDEPYRRVVVAVDFSEPSYAAAAFGTRVAPNATFTCVNAFEVEFESILTRGGATQERIEEHRRQAHEAAMAKMSAFAARLPLPTSAAKQIVVRGYPSRVILDWTDREAAQLVVIGKHAAGIVERTLVGSVSLRVLELAKCDVLVVPEQNS